MGQKKGQYYLSATDNTDFYDQYKVLLESNHPLCLAEKQGDYIPLLGDVDIKVELEDTTQVFKATRTLYSTEELVGVIKCFQSAIRKNVVGCNN
jgi:hypothetical protein